MVTNPMSSSKFRVQCTALILFDEAQEFRGNLQSATEWKTKVLKQTQKAIQATFVDATEGDGKRGDSRTSSNMECESQC